MNPFAVFRVRAGSIKEQPLNETGCEFAIDQERQRMAITLPERFSGRISMCYIAPSEQYWLVLLFSGGTLQRTRLTRPVGLPWIEMLRLEDKRRLTCSLKDRKTKIPSGPRNSFDLTIETNRTLFRT